MMGPSLEQLKPVRNKSYHIVSASVNKSRVIKGKRRYSFLTHKFSLLILPIQKSNASSLLFDWRRQWSPISMQSASYLMRGRTSQQFYPHKM
jgi:hypothetical protein